MGKSKNSKSLYRLKSSLSFFSSKYQKWLIVLGMFLLFGIVIGVVTASKISGSITIKSLLDKNLYSFLAGKKTNIGLFFSYLFCFLVMFSIIIFFNFSPWLISLNILVIVFFGYFVSFNVTCIIVLYPLGGIINTVLIIIPCMLCLSFCILLLSAVAIHRNLCFKKFGRDCPACQNSSYLKTYTFIILATIGVLFLMCMLMSLTRVTIIIV